jgi:organic hydroperoxide reductase OsmC/OhrA
MEEQETRERGGDGAAIAADTRIEQPDNNAEAMAASVSSSCYALVVSASASLDSVRSKKQPRNARTVTLKPADEKLLRHTQQLLPRQIHGKQPSWDRYTVAAAAEIRKIAKTLSLLGMRGTEPCLYLLAPH